MPPNKDFGPPANRVPPADNQVPEPQLWPLLYDLNGTVTRMDEAVDGLKERTASVDRRLEKLTEEVQKIEKEVSAARGSMGTPKWVLGLGVPVGTVLLGMILKKIGL